MSLPARLQGAAINLLDVLESVDEEEDILEPVDEKVPNHPDGFIDLTDALESGDACYY